jgi:hypothetical protein
MQRAGLIIFFAVISLFAGAQDKKSFLYYDSLTYAMYEQSDWRSLTGEGRKALNQGYDYYYMRMRVGISLYERRQYLYAISHFRKALEFSEGDPVATSYLYYSWLFSGEPLTASAVASDMPYERKKRFGMDSTAKNRMWGEYLFHNARTEDIASAPSIAEGYGNSGNLIIPLWYSGTTITWSGITGDHTALTLAATYLQKNNLLVYNDGLYSYNYPEHRVNQFQLYAALSLASGSGITFEPSIHYLTPGYSLVDITSGSGMNPRAWLYTVREHNIITTMTVRSIARFVSMSAEASWAGFSSGSGLQAGGTLKIMPLGNKSLSMGASAAVKSPSAATGEEIGMVYGGYLGVVVAGRVSLDITALGGDLRNYIHRSGSVVFNSVNRTDYLFSGIVSLMPGKSGLVLYGGAGYSSGYTAFIPDGSELPDSNETNYKSISITGGISWLF